MLRSALTMHKPAHTIRRLPATLLCPVIRLYQRTLSPDHGWIAALYPHGFCRHQPTCSQFAVDALQNQSLPRACTAIAQRLLSCHPWTQPSDDRLRSIILNEQKNLDVNNPC